jgi:exodeoxyribonuclease V
MTYTLGKPPVTIATTQAARALDHVADVMSARGYPQLTNTQREYAEQIIEIALDDSKTHDCVLEGPAGTGKTTTLVWIILALGHLDRPAAICAFTHKACSVLREKLKVWLDDFEFVLPETVHSLLNLRMRKSSPGAPLQTYQYAVPNLSAYSLVIVDECSLIGKSLFERIVYTCNGASKSVLFAGDPCQLKPVNESSKSISFNLSSNFALTEVLRHDGAILNLATRIRTNGFVPVIKNDKGADTSVIVHEGHGRLVDSWLQQVTSPKGDDTVMLTYTNDNRRSFNKLAREALHGPDVARFSAGDTVIALEPLIRDERVLYQNNQYITLTNVELDAFLEPIAGLGVTFKVWKLFTQEEHTLYVLDDGETSHLKKTLSAIRSKINSEVKSIEKKLQKAVTTSETKKFQLELAEAKSGWTKYFYPLKDFFVEVDYRYSMTIHKAQGSEWPIVYVNDDYTSSRSEKVELLYVAATRASRELHHIDNSPFKK